MPKLMATDKQTLYRLGVDRIYHFCKVNVIPAPTVEQCVPDKWIVGACAYYRERIGIRICIERCAKPASEPVYRNWNWPGSTTDREPYGVLAHELGHHCDVYMGHKLGLMCRAYMSAYSMVLRQYCKEPPITSYCDNDGEWFAEMFRLFVTNHALLKLLRPRTHARLIQDWKPVSAPNWETELGSNCPARIIEVLRKKINERSRR